MMIDESEKVERLSGVLGSVTQMLLESLRAEPRLKISSDDKLGRLLSEVLELLSRFSNGGFASTDVAHCLQQHRILRRVGRLIVDMDDVIEDRMLRRTLAAGSREIEGRLDEAPAVESRETMGRLVAPVSEPLDDESS
jgi:hypothetical protein